MSVDSPVPVPQVWSGSHGAKGAVTGTVTVGSKKATLAPGASAGVLTASAGVLTASAGVLTASAGVLTRRCRVPKHPASAEFVRRHCPGSGTAVYSMASSKANAAR
jgi:hypothetical protein